jgi:hypothetical protein
VPINAAPGLQGSATGFREANMKKKLLAHAKTSALAMIVGSRNMAIQAFI